MKWEISLRKWRQSRQIGEQPLDVFNDMLASEEDEFTLAIKNNDWEEQVDAVCDQLVLVENYIATTSNDPTYLYPKVDELKQKLTDLGVVPDLAMKQCAKHISARKQDPVQAARWEAQGGNTTGEKWQKDLKQDPATLYKANYKLCKARPRG